MDRVAMIQQWHAMRFHDCVHAPHMIDTHRATHMIIESCYGSDPRTVKMGLDL